MKTNTRNKIYEYILDNAPIWATKIANHFWFSNQIIHRHIRKLLEDWDIIKSWTPPKVYYFPKKEEISKKYELEKNKKDIIDNNFILFEANGNVLYWFDWFIKWCENRNINPILESDIYIDTLWKYQKYKNENWMINWIEKIKSTFEEVFLDEIYYLDFYSIEKYWKTMLWNLMLYGKQNSDKDIIEKIISLIKIPILDFINKNNIDSFAFIPPSINRKIQIMDKLNKGLDIKLNELKLIKIFRDKIVSQKSLSKKEDRIINARETIFIENKNFKSNKILLIDDAVWSGSTLNETAKKIKESWISNYVIWIAIVWSFKWFEIINEV